MQDAKEPKIMMKEQTTIGFRIQIMGTALRIKIMRDAKKPEIRE